MRQILDGARRRRPPHAQIHLPPLDADDALLVARVLESVERAIWRAHGDAMADRIQLRRATRPPPGAVADGNPDAPDNGDF